MEFTKHDQGTTSVKVHHQPGGASSFSLGGGYGEDKPKVKPAVVQPTFGGAVPVQQPVAHPTMHSQLHGQSPFAMDNQEEVKQEEPMQMMQ